MGKKYKNSPIIETLCEFAFIPSKPWDITIPGLFYEKVRNKFPERKQRVGFDIKFEPKEGGIEQNIEMAAPRIQFLRSDKTALLQVSTDLLVINHLKPYPTWNKFKPMILENLNYYKDVANPKGFKRIGLRYINKIDIPGKSIKMEDYFNFYPAIPKELPQTHLTFNINVKIPYANNHEYLVLTLRDSISEKPDFVSVVLDLYYIMSMPGKVAFQQVDEWIENAHTTIEKAFESCITDKCRKLFEEGE